jgi:hypothetical protein
MSSPIEAVAPCVVLGLAGVAIRSPPAGQFGNHMAIPGKISTSATHSTWITMNSYMPR